LSKKLYLIALLSTGFEHNFTINLK